VSGFWRSSRIRAGRHDHRCATCKHIIPKGMPSYIEAGNTDGDFNSYRSCVPCHDLVTRLYTSGHLDSEGFILYELRDIALDAGEPWPPTSQGVPA
jgi:hypothetical protein